MSTKSLVNAAMMIAVYLVFLTLYTIGILPSIASLLLPIPIIIYSLMSRKLSEIGLLFIACCIGSFLFASFFGLLTTVLYGLSGVILGWGLVKKWPTWQRILNSAIVYMIGFPLIIYLLTGMWISDALIETFTESFALAESLVPEAIDQLEVMQTQLVTTLPRIMPTLLLVMGVLMSFLSDRIANLILKRLKFEVPKLGRLREFQLGSILGLLYLMSLMGILFINQASINFILINVFLLLNILFTVQGIIVLYSLFKPRNRGVVTVIIVFLFLTNASLSLSLLGVIDALFDYRNRFKKREL